LKRILIIAKSSNEVLYSKIEPLALSKETDVIYLIRDEYYPNKNEKIFQVENLKYKNKIIKFVSKLIRGVLLIKKFKLNLILSVHLVPHGYLGFLISKLTSIPHIHLINAGPREIWSDGKLLKNFNLFVLKNAVKIIVQGSNTNAYLCSQGIKKENIKIINNVIEKKINLNIKAIEERNIILYLYVD